MNRRTLFAGSARFGERRVARAERLRGLTLSPIKDVELQASRIPGVVSLAQGIPSFDTPAPIKRFVTERMAEGACARSRSAPACRSCARRSPRRCSAMACATTPTARFWSRSDRSRRSPRRCWPASTMATRCWWCRRPTHASYLPAIRLAGGVPRFVPLNEDANFDLDADAIDAAAQDGARVRC